MLTETIDLFSTSEIRETRAVGLPEFPTTRYQGSKRKIVEPLAAAFREIEFDTALDLFSGTATVSLLLRQLGKRTDANDYLQFNRTVAQLLLSVTESSIRAIKPMADLLDLLNTVRAD